MPNANLSAALANLGFERATTDKQRASLLEAIRQFAAGIGDKALVEQACSLFPRANPWHPPPNWLAGFIEGFEAEADEDKGTDPEGGAYAGEMLWQMASDEWRRARVTDSTAIGAADGRKEAQGQNEA